MNPYRWLVHRCEASDAFSWGVVVFGIIAALFIGFYGR
jgi:hypothetical protein